MLWLMAAQIYEPKICFASISFLILIWSSSIPIFFQMEQVQTGHVQWCNIAHPLILLFLLLVFFLNLFGQPRFTHTQHSCHSKFPRWPDFGSFRFLEQSIEPTSPAFRARWVHYLSGRPIRSTAVAAEELITFAAEVTVLSNYTTEGCYISDSSAAFWRVFFSSWAACGLSSILDCLQRGRFFQHLECIY